MVMKFMHAASWLCVDSYSAMTIMWNMKFEMMRRNILSLGNEKINEAGGICNG
jgi:hypothetical protein